MTYLLLLTTAAIVGKAIDVLFPGLLDGLLGGGER